MNSLAVCVFAVLAMVSVSSATKCYHYAGESDVPGDEESCDSTWCMKSVREDSGEKDSEPLVWRGCDAENKCTPKKDTATSYSFSEEDSEYESVEYYCCNEELCNGSDVLRMSLFLSAVSVVLSWRLL